MCVNRRYGCTLELMRSQTWNSHIALSAGWNGYTLLSVPQLSPKRRLSHATLVFLKLGKVSFLLWRWLNFHWIRQAFRSLHHSQEPGGAVTSVLPVVKAIKISVAWQETICVIVFIMYPLSRVSSRIFRCVFIWICLGIGFSQMEVLSSMYRAYRSSCATSSVSVR